jgi:hypothetical protein
MNESLLSRDCKFTAGCCIYQNQEIQLELSQLLVQLLPHSCQVVVSKPCNVNAPVEVVVWLLSDLWA